MSFDATARKRVRASDGASRMAASEPAACILKHAVKIWARDHGVAEEDVSRLTDRVLDFANTAIRDCEPRLQVVV